MDYKPESNKEKTLAYLLMYAKGLSFRTGIPLKKINCSWLDESHHLSSEPERVKW